MASDSVLIQTAKPKLRDPLMIVAFKGWNDGGQAASKAVDLLVKTLDAQPFAHIDAETFYDFTQERPTVHFRNEYERTVRWPQNTFYHTTLPGTDRDVILFLGVEPSLRWRAYCAPFLKLMTAHEVECFVSLGAFLTEVLYSQPIGLTGLCNDPDLRERSGIVSSAYEGPTGIVGVLQVAVSEVPRPALSLWAGVPYYIAVPNPKASYALLKKIGTLFNCEMPLQELEESITQFDHEISELIEKDTAVAAYVEKLKQRTTLN